MISRALRRHSRGAGPLLAALIIHRASGGVRRSGIGVVIPLGWCRRISELVTRWCSRRIGVVIPRRRPGAGLHRSGSGAKLPLPGDLTTIIQMSLLPWPTLNALFDPTLRLELSTDHRYVKRPVSAAQRILDQLNLDTELPQRTKFVLCGSLGSGKSSELVHLAAELQRQDRSFIGLDLPRTVAYPEEMSAVEVLFFIGMAALKHHRAFLLDATDAQRQELERVEQELMAGLGSMTRGPLRYDLREALSGVATFAANLAVGNIGGLPGSVGSVARGLTPHGRDIRPARDKDPQVERLVKAVDDALVLYSQGGELPIILVDGLDKILKSERVNELFFRPTLSQCAASVIYTGPVSLALNMDRAMMSSSMTLVMLTNIVVNRPSCSLPDMKKIDAKIEDGRELLRKIVSLRLGELELDCYKVFDPAVLELLITLSGGLLRDLIRIIKYSIRAANEVDAERINEAVAEQAINDLRNEYYLTTQQIDELRHVAKTGEQSGSPVSVELALRNLIIPYNNGQPWFEPHPLLRGLREGL